MNLLELVTKHGGRQSVEALARSLDLDTAQTAKLFDAVSPALLKGIQKETTSASGLDSFVGALQRGRHQQYVEEPATMGSIETVMDGNKILGHLFGSKKVSREVAAEASGETGIDIGTIKKALPMLAGLAMGALSKNSDSGKSVESSLGGLLQGLLGKDSNLGGAIDFARKLF